MEIVKLNRRDVRAAAEVMSSAFFNYPSFSFYFPDSERRSRYLPWYLGNVLNCALRYGEVYTTPDVAGVAFTLPPGHSKVSLWEYVQNGFLLTPIFLGLRNYRQSMECEAFIEHAHKELMKTRPHYYLWGLAVEPSRAAKGIGAALMHPVLSLADTGKLPIYLETHDGKNVQYYQRHGFELIQSAKIPRYGLQFWCMVREPR